MTSRLNLGLAKEVAKPGFDIVSMFSEREPERYALHSRCMNEMMVRVLQTIGYDVGFRSGTAGESAVTITQLEGRRGNHHPSQRPCVGS